MGLVKRQKQGRNVNITRLPYYKKTLVKKKLEDYSTSVPDYATDVK